MRPKHRILLALLILLLVALLVIWLTPSGVATGLRLCIAWKARQENLVVKIDRVDAPFLRPVVIRGIHITNTPANASRIDIRATQATMDLNLQRVVLQMQGRAIRHLAVQGLRGGIERAHGGTFLSKAGWSTLQKLFPASFKFERFDLRLEDGPTVLLLRNATLSGSEIEAGRFDAGEMTVVSPWFRQTFAPLRGATKWQDNRLTVAGLSLTRGLDLQWIAIDLSQVRNQRVELDFDADAFGGKIRASISNQWSSQYSTWDLAGSGTDISLAQTSEALGFTDRIGGLVHACKFTFRGDPRQPIQASASLWTELTDLSWRNRAAEVIMLGASFYNREIDIQQLYIRQNKNQLTLRGQAAFPANSTHWLSPDFQCDISASINQLGDFAALFGANPGDFAGKIAADGTMNARDQKVGGQLAFNGASLTLFRTTIDTLNGKLNLKSGELEIEQLDLKRKKDFLSATGRIDMSHEHTYSGSLDAAVGNLAEYWSVFRGPGENNLKPTPANIHAAIESSKWDTHGAIVFPGSSPLTFTANFFLPIGTDWTAFLASPVSLTLDFPSIFLATVPQFFHPEIFRDGILSGKLSLSATMRRPRITGDVQLLNGKLQNASLNLTEASSRISFNGNRASIDFFNAAAKDVDLSLHGDIDFHDTNDLTFKITGATPIFDLTPRPADCVSRIEVQPIAATLAPAVTELEVRGTPFRSGWTISLKERISSEASPGLGLNEAARKFPICLGKNGEEKTLLLGAPPRPEPNRGKARSKKRAKRH